jgi:cytochrome P450
MIALTDFVPPYPDRLAKTPTPWERVRLGRRNLLGIFEEAAFTYKFGSMKLFGREIFLCNTPESVQFAFSTHNDSFERKSPGQRTSLAPVAGDGLIVSDGKVWRRRRRIVAPIVHISRMSEFAPIMADTAHSARERWVRLSPPAEIDVLSEMAQLTAEIICRTVFGRQLGSDRALQIVKGFSEYQRRVGQFDLPTLLGVPEWLPRFHPPSVYRSARRIHKVLDELIADTHRDGDATSIVDRLLDARDESGAALDAEALRNEAAVMLLAGHETTASSLAWTWYILSQTPEVEEKLHEELDRVLCGRLPTLEDVPKLLYTRAIFEEVLRLYPPIPLLTREAVHDDNFHGHRIPKGSLIVVSPWLLHRHRHLWHKPDHFIPERFMPGGYRPASKFAYIPFSVGPRICTGMAFATTEAILCIATIAQAFMLRLKPGHRVEVACRLTLRPGETLPMRLVAAGPANPDRGLRAVRSQPVSSPKIRTVGAADFNPCVRYGVAEGGDPSPLFDTDWYLTQYPDVRASGINPLVHYLEFGAAEDRDPSPLFDTDWYLARYPDVRANGMNPLVHYLQHGAAESLDPSPVFDTDWYLAQYPDVRANGMNPLVHYLQYGAAKGLDPSPLFDTDWYLAQYPDVRSNGMNPLVHYLVHGAAEGRDPSPLFDTDWYLARYPDVRANGMNPLAHYLRCGAAEGRHPRAF